METKGDRRRRKLTEMASSVDGGLSAIAERAECSVASLQQLIDVTPLPTKKDGTWSRKQMGDSTAERIEDAFKYPRGWFDTDAPTASAEDSEFFDLDAHPDLERVRKVNLRLEAGVNGFAIESEEGEGEPVFFRKKWLSSRGYKSVNLIAIKVMGNSMEPNLYPDDLVVVNTADTEPKDGKVFAVNYEGEAVVKRMVRDGGSWWLSSDNPDQKRFGRKECSGNTCLIIGRVIHKQSEQI